MREVKPIFKNELFSLQYDDVRFSMYDSDGNYINYLFFIENEENCIFTENFYVDLLGRMSETQVVEFIKKTFDVLKIEPECVKEDFNKLRYQWGDEYVCRIGNTAIIICEK